MMPETDTGKKPEKPEAQKTEPSNGKQEVKAKPSEEEVAAKADRTKRIIAAGNELYTAFREAGFTRDSFIELGESVKKHVPYKSLHPAVARLIMKVAKDIHHIL